MTAIKTWVRAHSTAVGVGLAATAGVALIVALALLISGIGEQVATASPTPSSSSAASPAPTPRESGMPAPSASALPSEPVVVWHGYQVRDVATPLFGSVWTRVAVDRLNVRDAASTDAAVAGVALRGDLLQVTGDPAYAEDREWAPVVGNGLAGWVATSDGEDQFLQAVATPWQFGSLRRLIGLVASDQGVLVYGGASDLDVLPYEGNGWRALLFSSEDGTSWQETVELGGPASAAAADGGVFVLAVEPSYIEPNFVRVSTDGRSWGEPIVLSFTARSAAVGPAGPLLVGSDWEGGVFTARVHPDGTVEETKLPAADNLPQSQVEASDAGYVAFDRDNAPRLLVSTDGATWNLVTIPGSVEGVDLVRDVELDGSQLVVVVGDAAAGGTSLRFGQLQAGGSVAWEAGQPAPFGSATVDSIALGGGAFLALGWDREELVPRVWRSADARTWTDLAVDPASFGGAIGPEPVFGGGRWYAATDAIYASDDGAAWQEVFRPSVPAAERPGCPPAGEVTALDLMFLGDLAADCAEDASLTFDAWIAVADGLGGCCWPIGEPAWLNPAIPPGFISAGPSGFSSSLGVYPVSGLVNEFRSEGRVRVTGHFHDPAAQECRRIPLADFPHRLEARASVVAECERRLVIDRVVRIDA